MSDVFKGRRQSLYRKESRNSSSESLNVGGVRSPRGSTSRPWSFMEPPLSPEFEKELSQFKDVRTTPDLSIFPTRHELSPCALVGVCWSRQIVT